MTKPLVFAWATVRLPSQDGQPGKTLDTWELIAVGTCPILHAVWDRNDQKLAVQFSSTKESNTPYLRQAGSKKNPTQELAYRKEEQYYITRISDKDAIEAILKNFVVNYDGQEWQLDPIVEQKSEPVPVESEV